MNALNQLKIKNLSSGKHVDGQGLTRKEVETFKGRLTIAGKRHQTRLGVSGMSCWLKRGSGCQMRVGGFATMSIQSKRGKRRGLARSD
ncbi:hypothetical protein GCM10007385_38900 [Tateyamaria omphalii]|nr:hypothetical protein GCM10007385_38900 [Tateyamaria omphalii]